MVRPVIQTKVPSAAAFSLGGGAAFVRPGSGVGTAVVCGERRFVRRRVLEDELPSAGVDVELFTETDPLARHTTARRLNKHLDRPVVPGAPVMPLGRRLLGPRPGGDVTVQLQVPRAEDEDPLVVKRWDYEPKGWERLLKEHGSTDVRASVLDTPPGKREVGTLVVQARA